MAGLVAQSAPADDPWASPAPSQGGGGWGGQSQQGGGQSAPPNDPWATPGVSGGNDEPPF